MATQELVAQLNPEHYDNLTDANATGTTNFGKSSCQNNTGTVFAVGSDDNVVIYTSNSYATKYATSISNPGNSNSLFGFKIAMDSPGDTIIIGAPGDNRVYVFDAQNQARTSWTQRSNGWNSNSYLGTSDSGTIHYGSDVDVAGDDDSLFVVGRPGDHKIELWSWPNGSSATLLKTITKSSNFGFSCKLSADGQVVIAGGPGNYYPQYNNTYGNGIAHVYAKDPSSATTWTERTLPFDYTDCPTYVEYIDDKTTTIKSVTDTNALDGGTKTPVNPAFGFSVAINKDGTFIAVSAPNRKCFFSAEWINGTSSYKWLTDKPITGDIDEFGSFLFMQYDGTRIITGNTSVEEKIYWNAEDSTWDNLMGFSKSYCVLDWNGIYYTNYSESFNLYSFGKIPTSISKNGEFALFSANYDNGSFIGNEARVTGSNRNLYTGNTVFSFTRFAPTIKILGTTTIGGDLKVRFLSVGGDKSYLSSNTSAGFVPGYINFENTRDEHSIFRSQIINTSQYTGDDNLSELLLFKSGHVRGLNSRGPDRIRLKSPSIILEGMTSENHPIHASPDQVGPVAESWSKYLKESSAVYSRLTLTGIGNVGIGIPEYADHIIKENWNLGSSSVLGEYDYYKRNANANAQAPPLINHRLVIDGTQSIQNGKLYINNPTSSNLITDGMAACYNTMTSACIQNTNSTNIPYVLCHRVKRTPLWSDEDGSPNYYDRMRLYNTVTYDDVNKGLYFGTSTSYAKGWIHSTRDTITGTATNPLSGVYTISYWFMLKDYAQSTFGSSGKLIFTVYDDVSFGYGHKITSSGFKIQYSPGSSGSLYTTAESDYTVNYTFNQNVWYHVCVKVDNTAGNGANEGTATTQLWINGVSQSLTANETNRDMHGRFPSSCLFGVVNQVINAYGGFQVHTLGGDGMYGHLIGNVKIYIAHDGTDYEERVAIPDYNTGPDFYNEGPPNEGVSISGGVNVTGGLRANGSLGTNGQVLTSSGGGAMSWTTVSGGGGGSSIWSLNGTNAYYNSGNVGINTSTPQYKLDVNGDINMSSGSSLRINGVAQSFGGGNITLGTGTTGDYVSTITGGNGITSTGATSGETIAHTLSIDTKTNGGLVIESNKLAVDLGASSITGTLAVGDGGTGATSLTNLITLGSHTQGNYVSTITGGNGITSTGAISGENTTHTLSIDTKTNGGLVIESNKLAVDLGASSITGTLAVGDGGTNITSYGTGDILYASSSTTLTKLNIGTAGQVLTVSAGIPSWAAASGGGGGGGGGGATAGSTTNVSHFSNEITVDVSGGPYDYMYNETSYNFGSTSSTFDTLIISTAMTQGQKLVLKLHTSAVSIRGKIERGSSLSVVINGTSQTVFSNFQDHTIHIPYDTASPAVRFLILEITKENTNQVTIEAKLSAADFTKTREFSPSWNYNGITAFNRDSAIHNVAYTSSIGFYGSTFQLRLGYLGVGHSHDFYFKQTDASSPTFQASQIEFYYNSSSSSWSQASQTNVYTNFDKSVGMTLTYNKEYRIHHEVIQASTDDYPSKILFTIEEMNAASGGGGGGGSYGTGDFESYITYKQGWQGPYNFYGIEIDSSFSPSNYNFNGDMYNLGSITTFDAINLEHTLPTSLPFEYEFYFNSFNGSISTSFKVRVNGSQRTTYNSFPGSGSSNMSCQSNYRYRVLIKPRNSSYQEWSAEWREYRS